MTTARDLADDLRVLRHPPGTAGRDLQEWLAAERRKDAKKAGAGKKPKKPEDQALHLAKTAHGALKSLNQLFLEHVAEGQPTTPAKSAPSEAKASVAQALENGRRWRERVGRFRSETYQHGYAETTGADRTQRRPR